MGAADEAIAFASAQIGKPYKWATAGPNTYDCSGLVFAAYRSAGVKLHRTTYTMITDGVRVAKADLLPGDLVFPEPTHVQLYVGNGEVIESPHTGSFVRRVKMYGFWQARRVAAPATSGNPISVTPVGIPIPGGDAVLNAVIPGFSTITNLLSGTTFWRRAGMFILGVLIVAIAVAFLNRAKIESAAKQAAKVGEVAAVL